MVNINSFQCYTSVSICDFVSIELLTSSKVILIIGSIELAEKLSAIEFNFIKSCNAILVKLTLGKYHFNTHPHPPTVKKIMFFF